MRANPITGDELHRNVIPLDYSQANGGKKTLEEILQGAPDPFINRFDGRVYYNPWLGIDFRTNPWMQGNRAIERAIWAYASSSQTVPTILPTFLDPNYIYAVPTDAPAFAALPRKASLGAMESYVRVTALGAPTSYWVEETKTPDYVSPTAARVNQQKRICQTWGGVTGFQKAAGKSFKDMLQEAHAERLTGFLTEGLENGIINGDDTNQALKGLLTWQGTTNGVDKNSTAVTIADIQNVLRQAWVAGGDLQSYGFALTDPTTYDYVKNLLMEYVSYVNVMNYDLPWGLKTFAVEGVPFLKSRKMPTGANLKKICFVDRRYTYLAVLQDVVSELYGKVSDEQKFAIKLYGAVVNRAPEFGGVIYEIA